MPAAIDDRVSFSWGDTELLGTVDRVEHGWVRIKVDSPVEGRGVVAVRDTKVSAVLVD